MNKNKNQQNIKKSTVRQKKILNNEIAASA